MAGQLAKLIELARLPNVVVQVLPLSAAGHQGLTGSFTILGYPWRDEDDIAFIPHVAGAVKTRNPEELELRERTFAAIRDVALDPDGSAELLDDLCRDLRRNGWS
ncbi:Scr1 family TA system antitoxin-like transcriptional regulator [Amycolatopsis cihanbeyliensis]|uniref:DUF5753 domain-containing protein n=1 Tax=Amycolatopsis cihanbeyliensis TaxID=1128664 RepID=A0A542DKJ7_AMYCI|nr:Scr1 family TA system antitoxin-like transcriptional regulator [Amycolatopsis cihanbeyliensis]TQJ03622.1 hypothetical protein FB471_3384 [Amycolatopsis cihanbeyliensis]